MTIALTTPVTGGAQTGFTTPTHTLTADTSPDVNAKQWIVSALGGTQTGATVHSVASPFTITVFKPRFFRSLGKANPTTGVVASVPMNSYKIIVRKGAIPLAGQPAAVAVMTCTIDVPAGTDLASPGELRSATSLLVGALNQQSAGVGDTLINGVL